MNIAIIMSNEIKLMEKRQEEGKYSDIYARFFSTNLKGRWNVFKDFAIGLTIFKTSKLALISSNFYADVHNIHIMPYSKSNLVESRMLVTHMMLWKRNRLY